VNVLIISSWYPSKANPLQGIFVQEQAEGLAEKFPDCNIIVSTWGQADGEISIRSPWNFWKKIVWRLGQTKDLISRTNGVWEIFNPALYWSHRLPFGGSDRLINAHRRNITLALKKFKKIDVIHAHVSFPAGYITSLLSQEFNIPFVLTEHMSPFPFKSLIQNGKPLPSISQAFQQADLTIAVSSSLAASISSYGYDKPIVLPNMVDENRFSIGEPDSKKIVFFSLGGITKQKGINFLLEAISLWNPAAEHFEFRIGGDGPMLDSYKELADLLGVSDRVRWLGAVDREQAPNLFRECHIFVLPSIHETFGIVYAEALASGKPIIATRCGGPEDIVNSDNGLLVDVGDIAGLSEAMQELANHWKYYDPVKIRSDFEKRFSRRVVLTQLMEKYKNL
jgi:glycosyltransferase involved in cell wall biosynthesis